MGTVGAFDLAEALRRRGLVSGADLKLAMETAAAETRPLGDILVRAGMIAAEDLNYCVAEGLSIPYVRLVSSMVDRDLVRQFPADVLRRHQIVPLIASEGEVTVVFANPLDDEAFQVLERVSPYRVRAAMASSDSIRSVLAEVIGEPDPVADESALTLHRMVLEAFLARQYEIHIEPLRTETRIRRRTPEGLVQTELRPREHHERFIEQLRSHARIDEFEVRRATCGRFRTNVGGVSVDVDVSILPTPHGDSAVLVIGTGWRYPAALDRWELDRFAREDLRRALARPGGLFVVNSQSREMRRALAYAVVGESDPERAKILTIETSSFRRVPEWTQVEGRFEESTDELERVLWQRPDVLLLDRYDAHSLSVALRAVLEGMRLVLVAPYVDSADVLLHLAALDLPLPLLDRAARLVLSVTSLPRLCSACREPIEEGPGDEDLGYRALGCSLCATSGRAGEVLVSGQFGPRPGEVRRLLRDTQADLLTMIGRAGHRTIRRAARRLVQAGIVSASDATDLL